jgi:hypothetical protein
VTSVDDGDCITASTSLGTAIRATSGMATAIWASGVTAGDLHGQVAVDGQLDVTGYMSLAPTNGPPVNVAEAKLFSRQNAGGKTELSVKFVTGAVQVIATQT